MTRLIQKRADELKPGDIFAGCQAPTPRRHVVLRVEGATAGGAWRVWLGAFDTPCHDAAYDSATLSRDLVLMVEAPDELTPAQEKSDLLVNAIVQILDIVEHPQPGDDGRRAKAWAKPARALIDWVTPKPPKPPTLEEALALLEVAARSDGGGVPGLDDFLDRARAAGVMK